MERYNNELHFATYEEFEKESENVSLFNPEIPVIIDETGEIYYFRNMDSLNPKLFSPHSVIKNGNYTNDVIVVPTSLRDIFKNMPREYRKETEINLDSTDDGCRTELIMAACYKHKILIDNCLSLNDIGKTWDILHIDNDQHNNQADNLQIVVFDDCYKEFKKKYDTVKQENIDLAAQVKELKSQLTVAQAKLQQANDLVAYKEQQYNDLLKDTKKAEKENIRLQKIMQASALNLA